MSIARQAACARGTDGFRVRIQQGETKGLLQNVFGDSLEEITLCLTRSDDPDSPGDAVRLSAAIDSPLVGEVGFGTIKGLESGVLFDWVNGLYLTVPCGNISLKCTYPTTQIAPGVNSDNLPQQVGVLVTEGTRPAASGGLSQARLTSRLGTVQPAATVVTPAPNRAHGVRLLVSDPALYGTFRVGFSPAISAVGAAVNGIYFIDPTEVDEMPLTAGTRAVLVTNLAAVPARLTLLWSISL